MTSKHGSWRVRQSADVPPALAASARTLLAAQIEQLEAADEIVDVRTERGDGRRRLAIIVRVRIVRGRLVARFELRLGVKRAESLECLVLSCRRGVRAYAPPFCSLRRSARIGHRL